MSNLTGRIFLKIRRSLGLAVSIVTVLAIVAIFQNCGKDSGPSSTVPSALTASTATFRVLNNTGLPISEIYISPSSAPTWGSNLLTSPLANSGSQDFPGFTPDSYDGLGVIVGALSTYFGYSWGISVNAGQTYTVTSTASAYSGSLKVQNISPSRTITGVYVSPSSSPTWGPNQISTSISPGLSRSIIGILPGSYDLRITWNSGVDSIYTNMNIYSLTLTTQSSQ